MRCTVLLHCLKTTCIRRISVLRCVFLAHLRLVNSLRKASHASSCLRLALFCCSLSKHEGDASQYVVKLAFSLGHLRSVNSLRKSRAFLVLLASSPFYAFQTRIKSIRSAILCCAAFFFTVTCLLLGVKMPARIFFSGNY